jgi:hypothetical protein
MAERIDNNLIDEILKDMQARLAGLEGMRGEMRDGFASLAGTARSQTWQCGQHSAAPAMIHRVARCSTPPS